MKKLFTYFFLLCFSTIVPAQTNWLAGWDGNGATGTTSKPSDFGWSYTGSVTFNTANSNSGSRYMDAGNGQYGTIGYNYIYSGAVFNSSRIFWIRWNSNDQYRYSFSGLEACKSYSFSFKHAWHNNANQPSLTVGIYTENGELIALQNNFSSSATKRTLLEGAFNFTLPTEITATNYYIAISSNQTNDCMVAITDLVLVENVTAGIYTSETNLFFDAYTNKEKTFTVKATGASASIVLTAPEQITLSQTSILQTETTCLTTITATYHGSTNITSGTIFITSIGLESQQINLVAEAENTCFTPEFAERNLAPDPTFSNILAMGGTGNRSLSTTQNGRCGTSCGYIYGGTYVQNIAWKAYTNYLVRAKVLANGTSAKLGVSQIGKEEISKQPTHTNNWEVVEIEFTTGENPGELGGVFFNSATATGAYIDNLEVYEAVNDNEPAINITDNIVYANAYTDKTVTLAGKAELHLLSEMPLSNTTINITSEDAWLFFDNIRPTNISAEFLQNHIKVNGETAVSGTNIRIAIYKHGTVIMAHNATYQPLSIYTEQQFGGSRHNYAIGRHTTLGDFAYKSRSFKLKRGYMATFATTSDGSGYSRVFIADEEDLEFSVMPEYLDNAVAFVRVVKWEYVAKKGWCGTGSNGRADAEKVLGTWFYTWSADNNSTTSLEYVPIRQNQYWPGWSTITNLTNVSHLLGINEPDQTDQANMTLEQVLSTWPEMLKVGLRVGTPAYANPAKGLYDFIDSCNVRGYRVDFVALHCYWGGKSAQNWYNDLKSIYERCGRRPLWITEWNNGANWTTETSWPDADRSYTTANAQKQLNDLKAILNVLDTCSFVERYSIYNWVQDCRRILLADGNYTLAGEYYRDNKSVVAYNKNNYVMPPAPNYKTPTSTLSVSSSEVKINITDANGTFYGGFVVEKAGVDGVFTEIHRETNSNAVKSYSLKTNDLVAGEYARFRIRTLFKSGTLSNPSNELECSMTDGESIQLGYLYVSQLGWNTVLFNQGYSTHPSMILGSSTRKSLAQLSPMIKQVSASSRFQIQLIPWVYQNITSLRQTETIPYIILPIGNYDFDGLKAESGRTGSIVGHEWITVEFAEPFETIPVVFANQSNRLNSKAMVTRVRNITTTSFEVKLQKEAAQTATLSSEIVSYLAISEGEGRINDQWVKVGKTPSVSTSSKQISYGDGVQIENPIFIAQMQTCEDDYTATIHLSNISNTHTSVIKQVERSQSVSSTSAETVGWLLVNPDNNLSAIKKSNTGNFAIYPNPIVNNIYLEGENIAGASIDIYNVYGILVKQEIVNINKTIDATTLSAGTYIMKVGTKGMGKFIKL